MFSRRSRGETIFEVINWIMLLALIMVAVYPLLYVALASLSSPTLIVQYRGLLLAPLEPTLVAYDFVLANPMVGVGYRNTLLYVTVGTTLNLILTTLGAYGLSRRNMLWKKPIMMMVVFTMFFSGGLVPTFLLVTRTLNLLDSPWALILPGAISTYNLIIMRTAFQGIPEALEDAARVDGANDFQILLRIILPLSKPVIAVMILFYAVGHWNAFFNAMIYLRTRTLYPLQLVLREILIANSTDSMMTGISQMDTMPIGETIKYATIMVATVPILLVYPFLQRYFVKGVMIGALKE